MPILESDDLEDTLDDLPDDGETSGELPDWLQKNVDKGRRKFFSRDREAVRPRGRRKNLTEPIADGLTMAGTMLTFVRPITGVALVDQSEDIAKALNDLAKTNDRLYRMLEWMTSGSNYGKLIAATLPVAAAAYVETVPNGTGLLSTQAVMVMERGLSPETMDKVVGFLEKAQEKKTRDRNLHPVA